MTNQPCIIGWAHSRFGKLDDYPDTESLIAATVPAAMAHADVSADEIDGIYLGTYNNGFVAQSFEAGLVGMAVPELRHVPAARLENACATGSAALYSALDFVASGRGRIALVVGVEKMTTIPPAEAADLMIHGSYFSEEGHYSPGFAGLFGHIAQSYFQRFGDQSDALAMISAKNHRNATRNPDAHMPKDLGFEFCNTVSDKNPLVAGPLRRTDCSPISDGAAVLVIADSETAKNAKRAVRFRGYQHANDFMALSRREAPYVFEGAARAWKCALDRAGITLDDLDLVETHDCFTIAEMLEYEAMGLAERGHECAVIAPSLIPRRPGERVKTNRRDAMKLARLFRAGELTEIWTPDEAHEAMRDLVRAREAAVKDRTRKRQEIRSFLLRNGRVYPGKKAWGAKYFKWLHELSFAWPAQLAVLHEMIIAETQCRDRVARLEKAIEDALFDWPLAPAVDRLQALRGVGLIAAVTFMVEVGDIRRFESPRQLMAYLGLVPTERSTGDTVRRGGITKTGNARVRRTLAESAWTYRYPARVGKKAYFATRHMPEEVRETAWKAQARLTKRHRALVARGKRSTVAITAVARELVGFMWAIARMEPMKV